MRDFTGVSNLTYFSDFDFEFDLIIRNCSAMTLTLTPCLGWGCDLNFDAWLKLLYISRENLLLRGNADYFDYISWTWNLYQRLPCVQKNKEPKAWIRTKSAYRTKQMFWQVWVYVENFIRHLKKGEPGKFLKSFISIKVTDTWTGLVKYPAKDAISRTEKDESPLWYVFNGTKELRESFKTRTYKK